MSGTERRKSWQSYARLKHQSSAAAAAASGFRPRSLATGSSGQQQSWTTVLLAPSSAACRNGGTSPPPPAPPPAGGDDSQTHAGTVAATLSPIASGSSSMSYAPKSSASTCGGTTVGGALTGLTPDENTAADGLTSHSFLLDVDQRLQHINSYVPHDTSLCLIVLSSLFNDTQ